MSKDILSLDERLNMCKDASGTSNHNFIEDTLNKLSNTPASEVCIWDNSPDAKDLFPGAVLDLLVDHYEVPPLDAHTLKFGEFVYLLFSFISKVALDEDCLPMDYLSVNMFFLLKSLMYRKKNHPLIKQLLSVNYNALDRNALHSYCLKNEQFGDNILPDVPEVLDLCARDTFDKTFTYEQVINQVYSNTQKAWMPHTPLGSYKEKMLHTYSVAYYNVFIPLFFGCVIPVPLKLR